MKWEHNKEILYGFYNPLLNVSHSPTAKKTTFWAPETQERKSGMLLSYHKGGLTENNVFVFSAEL